MEAIRKSFCLLALLDCTSIAASLFHPAQGYFKAIAIVLTIYLVIAVFIMLFYRHGLKS